MKQLAICLFITTLIGAISCAEWTDLTSLSPVEASAQQRAEAERRERPVEISNSLGMKFALIPAGKFVMGSPSDERARQAGETQHPVTLTQSFYLGTTEVTQSQWTALMEDNPSFVEGDEHPVETVTWNDAVQFCEKLSQKEGVRYRLPTEAEWEYACRAGTTTPFNTGLSLSTNQANYNGTAAGGEFRDETTPVGSFSPNAWGLYDMHGNVWEWCADWHAAYPPGEVVDPQGPVEGKTRVARGGCWVNGRDVCRSAMRGHTDPVSWNFHFGFRIVRELTP